MKQIEDLPASKRRSAAAENAATRPVPMPIRRPPAPRMTRRLLAPTSRRPLAPKQGFVGLVGNREETKPLLYRMSSSGDALLSAEFVQTLSSLSLTDSWYSFVPSMLGVSAAADAAAKAVIKAHELCAAQNTPTAVVRCDSTYVNAINALRSSLDTSDSALVAVGLLYLYEGVVRDQPVSYFSHAGGISAILLARSRSKAITPLTRACLYGNTHGTFQQPLSSGAVSPFDDPYWLNFEPATMGAMTVETLRLRKLANQSTIRLPGLIAKVRSLRQRRTVSLQGELLSKTITLARNILAMKDDSAENELLHHVTLKDTIDVLDKAVFRYSFEFKSPYEKETLLIYWSSRLMIVKLCMVLNDFSSKGTTSPNLNSPFDAEALDNEQERLVMSTLMCWQDGLGFVNPLSMIWGALMGRDTFRGKSVELVRSWVWTRYHDTLSGWPITYTREAMDQESDEVAGGPLTGLIAQTQPWTPSDSTIDGSNERHLSNSSSIADSYLV